MIDLRSGYKQIEGGVIPIEWDAKMLSELVKIQSGIAFASEHYGDTGPILLTPGNFRLDGGLYFNERNKKHFSGHYLKSSVFDKGNLVVVMTDLTPDCDLLGKPAFIDTDEPILHNQRIGKVVSQSDRLDLQFLYWHFLSHRHAKRMKDTATGSTVRHTSNNSILQSKMLLPKEIDEQQAIAKALGDVDGLIAALEALIAKKRDIKQGAMQDLLSAHRRTSPTKIGKVLHVRHGRSQWAVASSDGLYPILASGGEIGRAKAFLYDKPSVLIGRKGTIDRPQYVDTPFWTIDTLFYSEVVEPNVPKYLFYQFCMINWMQHNEASGVPSLNAGTIENVEINLHEPSAQEEIADVLTDMDAEIAALEAKLAKTRAVKQGMMQVLLTGEVRLV